MTMTEILFLVIIGGGLLVNFFIKSILLDIVIFFIIIALIVGTESDIEWLRYAYAFLLIIPLVQGVARATNRV